MRPSLELAVGRTSDLGSLLSSAWGFLVFPAGVIGREFALSEAIITAPALLLACGSMVAACRWVSRASVPLEAAQ